MASYPYQSLKQAESIKIASHWRLRNTKTDTWALKRWKKMYCPYRSYRRNTNWICRLIYVW